MLVQVSVLLSLLGLVHSTWEGFEFTDKSGALHHFDSLSSYEVKQAKEDGCDPWCLAECFEEYEGGDIDEACVESCGCVDMLEDGPLPEKSVVIKPKKGRPRKVATNESRKGAPAQPKPDKEEDEDNEPITDPEDSDPVTQPSEDTDVETSPEPEESEESDPVEQPTETSPEETEEESPSPEEPTETAPSDDGSEEDVTDEPVSEEVTPEETPSSEEPTPEEPAPAEPTPEEPAPAEPVPEEPAPAEPVPEEPTPAEPVPEEPAPAEPVPEEPAPAEPVPEEPAPAEPVPEEPVPAEPVPSEPAPVEAEPVAAYSSVCSGQCQEVCSNSSDFCYTTCVSRFCEYEVNSAEYIWWVLALVLVSSAGYYAYTKRTRKPTYLLEDNSALLTEYRKL